MLNVALAMIFGIVFTIVVGCGLMGLMFYSSRYGYDQRASDLSDRSDRNEKNKGLLKTPARDKSR